MTETLKKREDLFGQFGKIEWVRVAQWEQTVGIKNLSVNDRVRIGKFTKDKPTYYAALALVAVAVLDHERRPYFELSEECIEEIAEKIDAQVIDFLAEEVMKANGMMNPEEEVEEAKKN